MIDKREYNTTILTGVEEILNSELLTYFHSKMIFSFVLHKIAKDSNVFQPTVYTPCSRTCNFENHIFLKDLKKNLIMSPFCIPQVLKSAAKSENLLTNKNFMPENNFE